MIVFFLDTLRWTTKVPLLPVMFGCLPLGRASMGCCLEHYILPWRFSNAVSAYRVPCSPPRQRSARQAMFQLSGGFNLHPALLILKPRCGHGGVSNQRLARCCLPIVSFEGSCGMPREGLCIDPSRPCKARMNKQTYSSLESWLKSYSMPVRLASPLLTREKFTTLFGLRLRQDRHMCGTALAVPQYGCGR